MAQSFKAYLPHFLVVLGFIAISLAYFYPVLSGKVIQQGDIINYRGMAQQQTEHRDTYEEEPYWTDAAFIGMPTYQLGARYPHDYIDKLDNAIRFLPRPADYVFVYLLSFFILMLCMKLDWRYAALGAIAFGFSTYLIVILGVGHNAKAHAIAYFPLVLSGIVLTFRGKYIWGFLLTTVAMALELHANHYQMTYYLMLLIAILGIAYLMDAVRKGMLTHFVKAVAIMIVGVVIAIGTNASQLLSTQEYAAESTRGKSELTSTGGESSDGLSYEYITQYSISQLESFNLMIPRFMGGGSIDDLGENDLYDYVLDQGVPKKDAREITSNFYSYWGEQIIVEAPAYVGGTIIFLAIIGWVLIKGRLRWWLTGGILLSLLLSWGFHMDWLSRFFVDYVPFYNKFRAVSSIQVILELCLPILAVFGLYRFFHSQEEQGDKEKALKIAAGIVGGLCLVFALAGGSLFDFASFRDAGIQNDYGIAFVDALRDNRFTLMRNDSLRTLLLIGLITFFLLRHLNFSFTKKFQMIPDKYVLLVITAVIAIDLIGVDQRYVNSDDFITKREWKNIYQPNPTDLEILKDNGHYRVFDATVNAFNSSRASYFHKAFGGYHGAKPRRVEELHDYYFYNEEGRPEPNIGILNMLNVKYIIAANREASYAQRNPYANGPAWFINEVKVVANADEALQMVGEIDTKKVAVVEGETQLLLTSQEDSTATISITNYKANELKYTSSSKHAKTAVFAENYYNHGWNAYIDGTITPIERVDYVLRAINIPAGEHEIIFKFEPDVVKKGSSIALASNILLAIFLLLAIGLNFKNRKEA